MLASLFVMLKVVSSRVTSAALTMQRSDMFVRAVLSDLPGRHAEHLGEEPLKDTGYRSERR